MSTNLRNFTKAVYGFDHVMKLTEDRALDEQSPCADWSGRDVVNHVMGAVAAVQSAAVNGAMPDEWPTAGDDPLWNWEQVRDNTLAALDHPDVIHSTADTFFGAMPVDQFLGFMSADITVHTWDLARTGGSDDRLDPGLVTASMETYSRLPDDMLRGPNVFAAPVDIGSDDNPQDQLLAFTGRRP